MCVGERERERERERYGSVSALVGWYAPNHQGEGLHNGGLVAQTLMADTLANATGAFRECEFYPQIFFFFSLLMFFQMPSGNNGSQT